MYSQKDLCVLFLMLSFMFFGAPGTAPEICSSQQRNKPWLSPCPVSFLTKIYPFLFLGLQSGLSAHHALSRDIQNCLPDGSALFLEFQNCLPIYPVLMGGFVKKQQGGRPLCPNQNYDIKARALIPLNWRRCLIVNHIYNRSDSRSPQSQRLCNCMHKIGYK